MIRILATAAAALSVFATVPAAAQDLPTATVTYADLDLGSAAGQASLRHRVASAVEKVCPVTDTRDLDMMRERSQCLATARKGAATQVAAVIDNAIRVASKSADGAVQIANR